MCLALHSVCLSHVWLRRRLLLPFGAEIREAAAMCCLAPIAVFSTLFTDKVLGNAKLAGFTLSITAIISLLLMTGAHFLFVALA